MRYKPNTPNIGLFLVNILIWAIMILVVHEMSKR